MVLCLSGSAIAEDTGTCTFVGSNIGFGMVRDTVRRCGTVYVLSPITIDGEIDMTDTGKDAVFVMTYTDSIGDDPFVTFEGAGKILGGEVRYDVSTASQWSKWTDLQVGEEGSQELILYKNPLLGLKQGDEGYPILDSETESGVRISMTTFGTSPTEDNDKLESVTLNYTKPADDPSSGDQTPAPAGDDGGGGCNAGLGFPGIAAIFAAAGAALFSRSR